MLSNQESIASTCTGKKMTAPLYNAMEYDCCAMTQSCCAIEKYCCTMMKDCCAMPVETGCVGCAHAGLVREQHRSELTTSPSGARPSRCLKMSSLSTRPSFPVPMTSERLTYQHEVQHWHTGSYVALHSPDKAAHLVLCSHPPHCRSGKHLRRS